MTRQESPLERHLAASIAANGLPAPEREHVFHPPRRWRIDLAFVDHKLAVEIEGGAFRGPGHRSVGIYLRNIEKYNQLTLDGWRLLRFTSDQVKSGEAVALIRQVLEV